VKSVIEHGVNKLFLLQALINAFDFAQFFLEFFYHYVLQALPFWNLAHYQTWLLHQLLLKCSCGYVQSAICQGVVNRLTVLPQLLDSVFYVTHKVGLSLCPSIGLLSVHWLFQSLLASWWLSHSNLTLDLLCHFALHCGGGLLAKQFFVRFSCKNLLFGRGWGKMSSLFALSSL